MENLRIEYVPIDSITPYENNAKLHPQEQIEQIKRSIKDNGMNDPIGIWHDQVVEGHGRLLACKELGMTEVPVIRLDHMTDEQRRQYMLIHNQTTMNSGWDFDVLGYELEELTNFDADFYGFEFPEEKEEKEKPEVEFAEILNEENNYIVLKFNDARDWLQIETLFGLENRKAYSTRKDGKITKSMQRIGIGRVVDGADFLNKIGVEL